MKVAIGFRAKEGPWGGGNRFVTSLVHALVARGDAVCHALDEPDIDLILMIDPRWRHPAVTFTPGAILRYLLFTNPYALVVHRINECDERKNTNHMNQILRAANYCADHTVFVGSWLRDLALWQNEPGARSSVITNGADTTIFNSDGWQPWNGSGPLKLVTHHWGGNLMKGFDIYGRIDDMMADSAWRERIAFTYIGNLPNGFAFRNARYLSPLDGTALVAELKSHHAYVTASIGEPGGNHQNEGALCGLPLLYRRSGCLPEYCAGFGVSFDETDFVSRLSDMIGSYSQQVSVMPAYPHTSQRTCDNYLALFDALMKSRQHIISARRLLRKPWLAMRNQLPF
jgi:hypothetical protein